MAVVNEREIFEQKPWLNDDVQNVNRLREIAGGGGSSDFSTATVTVNGTTTIRGSLIYDDGETICSVGKAVVSSSSVTLILYKGVGLITVDGIVESASGSIEFDPNLGSDTCFVTGDCSLTVRSPI